MKLSVIIPCFNAAATIGVQLEALAVQCWTEPWEVIVVDNGSIDGSGEVAEHFRTKLKNFSIIFAPTPKAASFARNEGVRMARGELLAFCDADDAVGSGWVAAMGEALTHHDFVACAMDAERLNPPWAQRTHTPPQQYGLQRLWYPPYLPHAGAGTLGIKRSLFEKVRGFDTSLCFLEDTDFCIRLQLEGTKLHFVPAAVIHIRYRTTTLGIYHQSRNYAEYNVLLSKKFKHLAVQPPEELWKRYLADWQKIIRRLPALRDPVGRYKWIWLFGRQIGRLRGSIKHWTPPV
jgi:glycosyltransferase involved in cell wall biosynthesis